jgi:hypothetical protein
VIATEWQEFAQIDFHKLKATMRAPVIIDLRNFLNEEQIQRSGFRYCGIGGPRRKAFQKMPARSTASVRPFLTVTEDSDDLLQRIAAAE